MGAAMAMTVVLVLFDDPPPLCMPPLAAFCRLGVAWLASAARAVGVAAAAAACVVDVRSVVPGAVADEVALVAPAGGREDEVPLAEMMEETDSSRDVEDDKAGGGAGTLDDGGAVEVAADDGLTDGGEVAAGSACDEDDGVGAGAGVVLATGAAAGVEDAGAAADELEDVAAGGGVAAGDSVDAGGAAAVVSLSF